jgi:hypothetical protein
VNKTSSVWEVAQANWVIQFRIRLPAIVRSLWYEVANKLSQVVLSEGKE